MIKLVIFDLDDTLFPEKLFVEGGFRAVSEYVEKKYGISQNTILKELLFVFKRDGHGKIFDDVLKHHSFYNKKLIKILISIYRNHKINLSLYPGVFRMLHFLGKKYKLAIITDGAGTSQRKKIKVLGLKNLFDFILYTHDYGIKRAKPHPYVFKEILKHFNISPGEVVYIGNDPSKDFVGPKSIGIKTIRVIQGRLKNIRLRKHYEADYQINAVTEAPKILTKLH